MWRSRNYLFSAPTLSIISAPVSAQATAIYFHLILFYNSNIYLLPVVFLRPSILQTDCRKCFFKVIFGSGCGSRSPNNLGSTGCGSATLHFSILLLLFCRILLRHGCQLISVHGKYLYTIYNIFSIKIGSNVIKGC